MGKNLPAMQVPSLGQEDPLEKGIAVRSRILAWRIPWTEKHGDLQSVGLQNSWTWLSDKHFHFTFAPDLTVIAMGRGVQVKGIFHILLSMLLYGL